MPDLTATLLTPPGRGAVATIELRGSQCWTAVRQVFRRLRGGSLPHEPVLHRVWLGRLSADVRENFGDEVLLAVVQVEPELILELHGHGGRQAVDWLVKQLGASKLTPKPTPTRQALLHAPTLRTARILLDQDQGAFQRAVQAILAGGAEARPRLERLTSLSRVGRHLVEPWSVVLAGPPNVGKSSLMNALAGYQRSVVSEQAGTTRDVVTTDVAMDGWPVRLSDTAGLRAPGEALEAAGIRRAEQQLATADLVLWLLDSSVLEPEQPPEIYGHRVLRVQSKADLPCAWAVAWPVDAAVSARTGEGLPGLIAAIRRRLVPIVPEPGEGVPHTLEQANAIAEAYRLAGSDWPAAERLLRTLVE